MAFVVCVVIGLVLGVPAGLAIGGLSAPRREAHNHRAMARWIDQRLATPEARDIVPRAEQKTARDLLEEYHRA